MIHGNQLLIKIMPPNFFDHQDRLEQLGDSLLKLERTVDWEVFRVLLDSVYKNSGPSKGGCPPYDAVLMFALVKSNRTHSIETVHS